MADIVRVRFAPSPTGYLHMGNIRTALFNWLFARHAGGKFIIRIEDTDRERSKEEYVDAILSDFKWLGLDVDEGPGVGGPYPPYKQSERLAQLTEGYKSLADELIAKGKAYRCFCNPEEFEKAREAKAKSGDAVPYNCACRDLTPGANPGGTNCVRFRVPAGETITFDDMVLGATSFQSDLIGDFVIVKTDGFPTYNYAVIVDDEQMKITHVIRAEGHVSNTPVQCLLYDAFGWQRPIFAHLPSVLSADGKGKLSKRLGALSIVEYRRQGYLPEALVNYMALLGWSPGDDREIMTLDDLIRDFDLSRVKKSGARFDQDKLTWVNAHYMKQASPEKLVPLAAEALKAAGYDLTRTSPEWLAKLVHIYRDNLNAMSDLAPQVKFLFVDEVTFDAKDAEKFLNPDGVAVLREAHAGLAALAEWAEPAMEPVLKRICDERKIGFGKVAQPIRVALTGTRVSKGIFETLWLLGRERSLSRIQNASARFGN